MEKETEFEIDNIVLIDTCTFINLECFHATEKTLLMFNKITELDCPICISDLSMVELILGCNEEKELLEHVINLEQMEFSIFGRYEVLKKHIEPENIRNIIKNKKLDTFKKTIKTIRNNILLSTFHYIFLSYCQQLLMMLRIKDRQYWYEAFCLVEYLFKHRQEGLNKLLFETIDNYLDDKKENKYLLSELFKNILATLLPQLDNEKYNNEEVTKGLNNLDSLEYFLKLFDYLRLKKDPTFGDLCYIKPMMERFKKDARYNNLEDELTRDGINYMTMFIFSKRANFDAHDLIDLLNISMAGYEHINIHYYTDENKWNNFAKIEQAINPRCPQIEITQMKKNKLI